MASRTAATAVRVTRAKLGMNTSPRASTTLYLLPGPTTEMMTRASRILGNAVRASPTRMSTSSTTPPKYPVSAPMAVPHTAPMATVATAMANVVPAPCMTRLKMSRPKLSVPIQWARDGPASLGPASMALGS